MSEVVIEKLQPRFVPIRISTSTETFKQLSKSTKFQNEKVMRSSLDSNQEYEPLICDLIVALEPYWNEQSQSNGMKNFIYI